MPRPSPLGSALLLSLLGHAGLALVLSAWRSTHPQPNAARVVVAGAPAAIVWLNHAGLAGGGGGGGDRTPAPPRSAQQRGRDARTVPIRTAPSLSAPADVTERPPLAGIAMPAVSLAASMDTLPGTIQATAALPSASQGPGRSGPAGEGRDGGDGPGQGPGLGPGRGPGEGDGELDGLGAGVTPPVPIYRGRPRYTIEAVRARVQGSILVECVVQPSGTCTHARVVRTFEPPFGLDREAILAAGEWRFRPGRRGSQQIPVRVTIEVAFTIQ